MGERRKELVSGVFYTSIAKYAGVIINLVVAGVLARLLGAEEFGIVAVATVIIAFFSIFSDLGIGPAVIQRQDLDRGDLDNIFTLTVASGLGFALLFCAAAGPIAAFYDDGAPDTLRQICLILSLNLFFASANIVPNALLYKAKRFRFLAIRSLAVQLIGGAAGIAAACRGMGIYALTVNPVLSSILIFAISYRAEPLRLRWHRAGGSIRKVFAFSAWQFAFQVLNYFSRNLDKLLMGKYISKTELGYYEKSYRLMMMPLQNIAFVITPVMHPVFAELQNDLRTLAANYMKVVKLLAFIGFPLSIVLFATARELMLLLFGSQWVPAIAPFRILALSVGIQLLMSTTGSIFQAANATRMLFLCGLFSSVLNVAAICLGIFAFGTSEAVAWCICASFLINFVQCCHALFRLTLRVPWGPFWRSLLSPLALTALIGVPLEAIDRLTAGVLPEGYTGMIVSLSLKGAAALLLWAGYVQLRGEYDLRGMISKVLHRK